MPVLRPTTGANSRPLARPTNTGMLGLSAMIESYDLGLLTGLVLGGIFGWIARGIWGDL